MMMDVPKDKNYPFDAVQCDGCRGYGCRACSQRGWWPARHSMGRLCEREGCDNPIPPAGPAVYCSVACAMADA